ncbi:probable helicase senataxin [Argiope bruennichi]|uniref:probable helicase senataxin n=1 Tax=Argiope bruennichi TaxID=94029 RepID=UPI002495A756|nr:probable helicase senataxin [Argiope bruennichi]
MAMDYFLKQINPANSKPLIICLETNEVTIGRSSVVSLTGFNKVSRKHASFMNKNGRWFVRDLGSLNKLYVNFKEVNTEWVPLEIGDIVGFGTPSYIEDGGLVCVFAAKNRIKQEVFEEIEAPNCDAKNSEKVQNVSKVKDVKLFTVKQELSSNQYGGCQQIMTISKPECTFQTDVSSVSASTGNNVANITKINSGNTVEPSNKIAPQNKYESSSKESKPIIKTEPNGTDDNELPSVKDTSFNKHLPINFKKDVEDMSICDNIETTPTCEAKLFLKNNAEDTKQMLDKNVTSELKKANTPINEWHKEDGEQNGKNDLIPHENNFKCSGKLQDMKILSCHKTRDIKYLYSQMKNCSVRLVRCDSKYFRWPPEINFNKIFASVEKHQNFSEHSIPQTMQDAKEIEGNNTETRQEQNSEYHQSRKKFKECIREVKSGINVALKLKVTKNRIMSSSSETSGDESESEKKDAKISKDTTSDNGMKTKSKKPTEVNKSRDASCRKNRSLHETFEARKVPEKRKQGFFESPSTKRAKHTKKCENPSRLNDSEHLSSRNSANASSRKADYRNMKISRNLRDESSFYVPRNSYYSKYWTPEYNEFETGEIRECLKPDVFFKTKQTAGRTLLTDPKPMEYRPRRMRGREEWFKERCSYSHRHSDQNERISEKGNEGTSYSSKSSSGQGFASSKEHPSIVNRKISAELSSHQTLSSSKGNTSNASQKNPTELFPSERFIASRGNISTITRRNTIEEFSSEPSEESNEISSIVSQRNTVELISNQSFGSLEENFCMASRKQSLQHKPENASLINSTAVMIQNNTASSQSTSLSIPRRRFLVEIQTNADEVSKNEGLVAKETVPQCSEKQDCNSTLIARSIKNINISTFSTVEATRTEEENQISMNNTIASISSNPRIVSLPASTSTFSFEVKNQMNCKEREATTENKISTSEVSDISEIRSKLEKIIEKTRNTQFLPKEIFSKTDKMSNDRKVAVVSPVNHDNLQPSNLNQPDTVSTPYLHTSIKEKITNRVHSTYILSPVKPNSKPILSNSEFTSAEEAKGSASETKSRSRYLIKSIVYWNPKWLEEQAKNKKPPPVISKGGSVLPLRFSSYDSYMKSFNPMISLEIWESLFRESKPLWLKKEVRNSFYFLVRSNNVQHSLIELQCESIVNENFSFLPSEGNIILLGISDIGNGLENSMFGYIHRHKVESALEKEKMTEWQKVPKEWQENAKLWTFSMFIKKSKKDFQFGTVSVAYGILNIRNKLQLADALIGFKDSPIQNDILRPTKEMFSFCKSISRIPRPLLIQTVSDEIKKENPHSKLILINAPAGTGKTGAIIGIVEKLLFNSAYKMKLLLCASSDMTIDEIGLRLVELNERCSWRRNSIKFIRLGQSENIPAKLQIHTLEKKILKMFKEQNKKEFQEREKELKVLEDKINDVLFKEQLKTNNRYRFRKSNDEALKCLMNQLQSLKEKNPYKNLDPVIHAAYESAILGDSDVILATLNTCMHPLMRKFFKSFKGESHACCIIDEISQCTELEVLQCLHPEINRLVLVGDLQQLQPPVASKYAIKWGFRRSMMERILKLFSVQFSCPPPLSLAEQHRMQSQICHFPSKYFYKDQLLTAADVDEKYRYSPLKPFVVYDVLEKEMLNPPANIEDNEPFLIANICAQLLQAVPAATIGVIVAHEDLAALYKIPLSLGNTTLKEIEINTVENYQGIERDIIIISCINPSLFAEGENFLSCEKKMNVAITRARQSLVICGHVSSMRHFKHWDALISDAQLRKNFISVSSLRQIPFVIMKTICRMS